MNPVHVTCIVEVTDMSSSSLYGTGLARTDGQM